MNNITKNIENNNRFNKNFEYLNSGWKVDSHVDDYRISKNLGKLLIGRIMSGTNEQAFTVLNSVGAVRFVPGIGAIAIPMNEFADFYDVSEKYLHSVLQRRGFVPKNYPDDISRRNVRDIENEGAQIVCCGRTKNGLTENSPRKPLALAMG